MRHAPNVSSQGTATCNRTRVLVRRSLAHLKRRDSSPRLGMTLGAQRALVRPLLPRDPAFQDVVQVAGADDLLRSGVEDGRIEEEWLSL